MIEEREESSGQPDPLCDTGGTTTSAEPDPNLGSDREDDVARQREPDETQSQEAVPQAAVPQAIEGELDEVPPSDSDVARLENLIEAATARVLESFEKKLAYDATKQLQIDRLHEELQQHRAGLAARAARPLVHGMIGFHDDIGKLISALRKKPAEQLTPDRFFKHLEGLQEDVEIVLKHNGVTAYRSSGNDSFDPRRQSVARKVGTSDKALAGSVVDSVRPGFELGADILMKERVSAYAFDPQAVAAESPKEEPPGTVGPEERAPGIEPPSAETPHQLESQKD